MEFRRNILLTILFLTLISTNFTYSQIKAVNDKGEKIIVYPDGTWKYDTEGQEPKEEIEIKPEKEKKPKVVEEKTYTREEMRAARDEITKRYRKVRMEKETAQREEGKLSFEMASYEQDIERKRAAGEFPRIDADEIAHKSKMNNYKRQLTAIKKRQKAAGKLEKKYQKMLTYPGDKLMVAYEKMSPEVSSDSDLASNDEESKPKKIWNPIKILNPNKKPLTPEEQAREDYKKQLEEVKKRNQEELEQKMIVSKSRSQKLEKYYNEVPFSDAKERCDIAFDEMDAFTGKRKRATKSRLLFSQVDEGYESVLKGKGYLECNGFLSEINGGKETLLILDYMIRSKDGRDEFGGFNKGSKLVLMLLDGTTIDLKNNSADKGTVDIAKAVTTFRGFYTLEKSELKELMGSEISMIRVFWADGYEDYDIYELDFFMDQIQCLKKTK